MIAVDTQIICYHFLPGVYSDLTDKLFLKDPDWVTSELWKFEFRNILAEYIRKDLITPVNAVRIAEEAELFLRNKAISIPPTKIVDLIQRSKCTAYDLEFVAVAEELRIKLITTDKEIIKYFPEIAINIKNFLSESKSA